MNSVYRFTSICTTPRQHSRPAVIFLLSHAFLTDTSEIETKRHKIKHVLMISWTNAKIDATKRDFPKVGSEPGIKNKHWLQGPKTREPTRELPGSRPPNPGVTQESPGSRAPNPGVTREPGPKPGSHPGAGPQTRELPGSRAQTRELPGSQAQTREPTQESPGSQAQTRESPGSRAQTREPSWKLWKI